jgi:hypothetical protein
LRDIGQTPGADFRHLQWPFVKETPDDALPHRPHHAARGRIARQFGSQRPAFSQARSLRWRASSTGDRRGRNGRALRRVPESSAPVFGVDDDVGFGADPGAGTVQSRAASRLGRKDFGGNRSRIERIRAARATVPEARR